MSSSTKQTAKRIFCYLMAVLMLITSTPLVSWAAQGREQARAVRQVADTLRPLTDVPGMTTITVKHVFQSRNDPKRYAEKYGDTKIVTTTQEAIAGTRVEIQPLPVSEREGYVPQKNIITVQVPKNIGNFVAEYRYNRASYDVKFNTEGGMGIPTMHLYYGQTIPMAAKEIGETEKPGSTFLGWKADQDLTYIENGAAKTLQKGTVINKEDIAEGGKWVEGFPDAMPANTVTFTAVWKEKEKADYTIQYWTQKPESGGETGLGNYVFAGAKIVKEAKVGSRPDLDLMTPEGIDFPEAGKVKLIKDYTYNRRKEDTFCVDTQPGDRVDGGFKYQPLIQYYVRNVDLIKQENTDPSDATKVKKVDATGNTVYNIYYDRQTYTIIFEQSSHTKGLEARMAVPQPNDEPPIQYDSTKGPNYNPYKIENARFGARLWDWPDDSWFLAPGTGIDFPTGKSTLGWTRNRRSGYEWQDTPPYWMTRKDFINKIPRSQTLSKSLSTGEPFEDPWWQEPMRTLSMGNSVGSEGEFAFYYLEYHFQGLDGRDDLNDEPNNDPTIHYINDPLICHAKIDTNSDYKHPAPAIPGFEIVNPPRRPKQMGTRVYVNGDPQLGDVDKVFEDPDLGRTRKTDEMTHFWPIATDEFGDPLLDPKLDNEPGLNGIPYSDIEQYVLPFQYTRNKYMLRLQTDPMVIHDDDYFDSPEAEINGERPVFNIYYQRPYRTLNLNTKYALSEKYRPESLPNNYVFKGWAIDRAGMKRIEDEADYDKWLQLSDEIAAKKAAITPQNRPEMEKEIQKLQTEYLLLEAKTRKIAEAKKLEKEIQEAYDKLAEEGDTYMNIRTAKEAIRKKKALLDDVDYKMPNYTYTLYAQWGEKDLVWNVRFDPNGGEFSNDIKPEDIATHKKGDPITTSIGKYGPQEYVMPMRAESQGDVQVFKISNRMSIKPPKAPMRVGYDFMGWEFVRYDKNGNVNRFFQDKYKLPELYSFGNEVVSDVHLRAIWVKNPGADIRNVKPLPVGLLDTTQELHYFAGKSVHAGTEGVLYAKSLLDINPYAPIECAVLSASDKVKAQNKNAA